MIVASARAKGLSRKAFSRSARSSRRSRRCRTRASPRRDPPLRPAWVSGRDTYQLEGSIGIGSQRGARCTEKDSTSSRFRSPTAGRSPSRPRSRSASYRIPRLRDAAAAPDGRRGLRSSHSCVRALRLRLHGHRSLRLRHTRVHPRGQVAVACAPAGRLGRSPVRRKDLFRGGRVDDRLRHRTAERGRSRRGCRSSTVFGVGFGIANGKSTYPNGQFILAGEAFAVHDDVPGPVEGTGSSGLTSTALAAATSTTTSPACPSWPRTW